MDGLIRRAAVAAGAAVVLVGPAVWAAGPAAASTAVLYAYAGGTGSPAGCPQDTTGTASKECSFGAALTQAGPGGTIDLATAGGTAHYVGNWTVGTAGTSATAPVTIEAAPGLASQPVLDGGGTSGPGGPVLTVPKGEYLALSGITITNGNSTNTSPGDGNGGGLDNAGTVTITGSTFTGNHADYHGGAIDNGDGSGLGGTGSVTVTDSTFTGNTTNSFGNGGAIDNGDSGGGGTIKVTASTFTSNNPGGGDGGAIDNGDRGGGGTVTVTASTFSGNGGGDGGAIDSGDGGGGTVQVTGSTFSGNSGDSGGAIDSADNSGGGTVQVTASTFFGNTAQVGGGISSGDSGGAGTVTVTGSTFSGDTSSVCCYGAEINNMNSGTVQVAGDLFNGSCARFNASTWTDGGYNAGTDTTCFASTPQTGDKSDPTVGSDLQSGPTGNGGPTQTIEPTTGNKAIGLIPNPTAVTLGSGKVTLCPTVDQRGFASAAGAKCDAGAVQTTGTYAAAVTGLKVTPGYTSLTATWKASSGATSYQVTVTSHQAKIAQTTVTGTSYRLGHLKQKTSYGVHVLAQPAAPGQKATTVYVTTK